jgi:hypothetical protein
MGHALSRTQQQRSWYVAHGELRAFGRLCPRAMLTSHLTLP